jgi:hypothetical protein
MLTICMDITIKPMLIAIAVLYSSSISHLCVLLVPVISSLLTTEIYSTYPSILTDLFSYSLILLTDLLYSFTHNGYPQHTLFIIS